MSEESNFDALYEGLEKLINIMETNIEESLALIEEKVSMTPLTCSIEYSEDGDMAFLKISGPIDMVDPWVKMIMTPCVTKRIIKK